MAKQEEYKVNDYLQLNQSSRRKIAFSIQQLLHSKVTTNPSSLSLCVFSSSVLEPKKEENLTPRRVVVHVSWDSHTLPPSINTAILKRVHIFSRGIHLKVNVIVWLELELTMILQSSILATTPWWLHPPIQEEYLFY